MSNAQSYQEAFDFAAPQETVFDAILTIPNRPKMPKFGDILETRVIVGQPGVVGFEQQVRYHHGPLDLVAIERLTDFQRPERVGVLRTPDSFCRHDPTEREIPFLDSMVEDLDGEFVENYGDPPFQYDIAIELAPLGADTRMTISVTSLDLPKLGWARRRIIRRRMKQNVSDIADQIRARL